MSDDAPEDLDAPAPSPGRRLPFTWLGLLAAGWVLYEVTAQPAFGTALVCLKFGWEDFRTARWLRQTDPDRRRGRACFWVFVAWGLWQTAAVAFLTNLVVFIGLAVNAGRAPGVNAPVAARLFGAAVGTGLVLMVGFALSAAAAAQAAWLAWRGGYRLWLNGSVRRAAAADVWPPSFFPRRADNWLGLLLISAAFVASILGASLSILCVPAALKGGGMAVLGGLGTLLGVGWIATRASRNITAASPAECWPPTPVDPAPADPVGW